MHMRILLVASLPLLLSACTAPPAAYPESEFVWATGYSQRNANGALLALREGFRRCTHWEAQCFLADDEHTAECDVFERSDHYPVGMIKVHRDPNDASAVIVRAGTLRSDDRQRFARRQWLGMVDGGECR